MKLRKSVRVLKKVRLGPGRWQFVSLPRKGNSWVWDPRPGLYLIEWWEGPQRRRESAGQTPIEVLHAVRRKQLKLAGQVVPGNEPDAPAGAAATRRRGLRPRPGRGRSLLQHRRSCGLPEGGVKTERLLSEISRSCYRKRAPNEIVSRENMTIL